MRKKNKASRLLALLCSLAMVLSMMPLAGTVYADGSATTEIGGVKIDGTNFPDANFRAYLNGRAGDDSNLSPEEIEGITEIGTPQTGYLSEVTNLTGLDKLTSLTFLNCYNNNITTWPSSWPSGLTTLNCSSCGLSELPTLPDNLTTLYCGNNNFTELTINATALTELDCGFSPSLAKVDVSDCTKLEKINHYGAAVTELTLAEGKSLKVVDGSKGGTAYIVDAIKANNGNWTAHGEIILDDGYACKGYTDGNSGSVNCARDQMPEITVDSVLTLTFSFTPIITGFTAGQTFTRGQQISFTANDIGIVAENSEKPISWLVYSNPNGDETGLKGNFDASKTGTIDTSSLSAGEYKLYINYDGSQGEENLQQDGGDSDGYSRSISFNIEESHYTGPTYYYLNVEYGSGDGAYTYNTRVDIEADPAPEGKEFDKWVKTSGEGAIENADAEKTVYTMGFGNATVTATYKDKKPAEPENAKYRLTVENGSGSGAYAAGTKVAIKADKAGKDKVFDKWILIDGKGLIKEKGSSNTVFTMAESDATVKAVYKEQPGTPAESDDPAKPDKPSKPDNQKGHDNPDNPQTGDTQMLFAWMTILAAATAGIYILNRKRNELEE